MTTFGDQLYQYGGVPVAKAGPMSAGKVFFVRPSTGSNSNKGTRPDQALATVTAALAKTVANRGDIVYLISEGNSAALSTSRIAAGGLDWNKDLTHLVGISHAGGMISPRARLSNLSTDTTTTDLFTVSANSALIADLQILHGVTTYGGTAPTAMVVSSDRSVFRNLHIAGMGATDGLMDLANGASLSLEAAGENMFDGCYIGLETTAKGTNANSEIRFESSSARNVFRSCVIKTWAEAAGHQYVIVPASGLQGINAFIDSHFYNAGLFLGPGATMSEAFDVNGTQNGGIILSRCTYMASELEADTVSGKVYVDDSNIAAGLAGQIVVAT
jgi:hypothetical protein